MGSTKRAIVLVGSRLNLATFFLLFSDHRNQGIMTVAVEKLSFAPMPSAKSRKNNSSSSKRRINKKALKARRGRTLAQCVYMSVRAAGKSGLSFTRIAECMKKSGVEVSNFVLMKVMKKMKKQRVLKCA